ncbi:hypothetical protein [Candidatus Flexifilum breve]|uniref:hypothetical protein n=1 Tax=Candidatus Flexifilum breve TaxID=3140694 RepID=UPI0031CC471B
MPRISGREHVVELTVDIRLPADRVLVPLDRVDMEIVGVGVSERHELPDAVCPE